MDTTEIISALSKRQSIGPKYLQQPAPSEAELLEAVQAALAVPSHKSLRACRLVEITKREELAALFEQGAIAEGADEQAAKKANSKALKAPALLAVVVKIEPNNPEVPVYEQWISCGAFTMTIVNCLELKGFGIKIVSGSSTRYPAVVNALCNEGEQVACWILTGTPTENRPQSTEREKAENHFSRF